MGSTSFEQCINVHHSVLAQPLLYTRVYFIYVLSVFLFLCIELFVASRPAPLLLMLVMVKWCLQVTEGPRICVQMEKLRQEGAKQLFPKSPREIFFPQKGTFVTMC